MEIMTSWKEEGLAEGASTMALRLLRRRLGPLPETLATQVKELSTAQMETLAEDTLDLHDIAALEDWLRHKRSGMSV